MKQKIEGGWEKLVKLLRSIDTDQDGSVCISIKSKNGKGEIRLSDYLIKKINKILKEVEFNSFKEGIEAQKIIDWEAINETKDKTTKDCLTSQYARNEDGNIKTEKITDCCESSFFSQVADFWLCGSCEKQCSIISRPIFKTTDDTKKRRNGLAKVLEENLEGFDSRSNLVYFIDRYYDKFNKNRL